MTSQRSPAAPASANPYPPPPRWITAQTRAFVVRLVALRLPCDRYPIWAAWLAEVEEGVA